jgi:two-component system, LytTR family, sensor kinase
MDTEVSFKEDNLLLANLKYGGIGLSVGAILTVFHGVYDAHGFLWQNAFINILYSSTITLSITNSVFIYERFLRPKTTSFWKFVAGFYCCCLVGLVIGTELSHLVIWRVFNKHFCFNDSLSDYKFNAFVVIVVSSILLLYQAQKMNMQSLLKAKELDLAKVNQLKTQAELQTLQSKINPHFLYNSLNSIASLIHEDPDKAEDMTLKLSKLFRYSINSMQESFATVKEEIEILNTYLDIEKIRFGKRINFSLNVAPGLEEMLLPRFLVQPLVENALKHGLKDSTMDGRLSVDIKGDEKLLVVTVADNGIPFPDELNIGYGLQSTYDKLELLYGGGYEIKISNVPEKSIKIIIPNKNER